ncbi:glycosyltransferase [Neisseria weaveri]|uniref:Glycoside hydrolase family protein n=1 Tax=Neisseria weaveri TaxID=28091 RepID=A0A3S5CAR2_9NEIS|nr:glycosyltransferase [Neisseria weaveri]EGV37385.1 glycosyl transferase, group 1 family [Neisseria weaveri LMG 5135]SAY50223.1 glycoside hydrolase family protein [Neisseria weaveri]VEJ51628.1 glycoside hydrolase family protein [Neisseria weaveri]
MNITIVAPYCSLPSEPHFNRFWYLAERLAESHNVLLITSNFKHYDKSFRRPEDAEAASKGRLKVKLLRETGYTKNVSLDRLKSHHAFVQDLKQWLESCTPGGQDVVFSAYPLIATNIVLGEYKQRLGYKLIIDVQDVWPESFSTVIPFLKNIPHRLMPFSGKADKAYAGADGLVAVSRSYLKRAREANPSAPGEVVYIGADFDKMEQAEAKIFPDQKIRFFYLGTLSFSYDMETVCKGIKQLNETGADVELHIMGGGPDLKNLEQYADQSIKFYGYIPYTEMMSVAKGCDIAINPIHAHSAASITNKLSDYMALQKPILNSQVHPEVEEVLNLVPHVNYQSGNVGSFVQAARQIMQQRHNPIQTDEILQRFKRDISYRKIINLIERLHHEQTA